MKAITCSQCGALITDISFKTNFVQCKYCNAKVVFIDEKIIEISKREAEEAEMNRRKWKTNEDLRISEHRKKVAEEARTHHRWMATQIIFLITILLLPFLLYYLFNG